MRLITIAVFALSSCASLALPTRTIENAGPFSVLKRSWNSSLAGSCDVSNVEMPAAPTPLPAPSGTLTYIAIGRGTQNYTCASDTSNDVPEAVGALATLYNANCAAAYSSYLLSLLPRVLYHFGLPDSKNPDSPLNDPEIEQYILGHHYFTNSTSPTFNLDTSNGNMGISAMAKTDASNPPTDALLGHNKLGSVQWLYLTDSSSAAANEEAFSTVYRLMTVGGNPPATCQGMRPQFEIQYAAQYWFFR